MRRRTLLQALTILPPMGAIRCLAQPPGEGTEAEPMARPAGSNPLAPWHMWGSSVNHAATLQAVSPSPFDPVGQVRQLAKINYGRPDTWTFLFGMSLVRAPDNAAASNVSIRVDFELTVGIGRSSYTMRNGRLAQVANGAGQGFCRLELAYTTPLTMVVPFGTWTTNARGPGQTSTGQQTTTDAFPAQDIQCNARIFGTGGAVVLGAAYEVEVAAFFAPKTHIRPDWFDDENPFAGGELGGT